MLKNKPEIINTDNTGSTNHKSRCVLRKWSTFRMMGAWICLENTSNKKYEKKNCRQNLNDGEKGVHV